MFLYVKSIIWQEYSRTKRGLSSVGAMGSPIICNFREQQLSAIRILYWSTSPHAWESCSSTLNITSWFPYRCRFDNRLIRFTASDPHRWPRFKFTFLTGYTCEHISLVPRPFLGCIISLRDEGKQGKSIFLCHQSFLGDLWNSSRFSPGREGTKA